MRKANKTEAHGLKRNQNKHKVHWMFLLCLVKSIHNTLFPPAEFWTDWDREARQGDTESSALFPKEALQKVSWICGAHDASSQDRVEKSQGSPIGKILGWMAMPSQPKSTGILPAGRSQRRAESWNSGLLGPLIHFSVLRAPRWWVCELLWIVLWLLF